MPCYQSIPPYTQWKNDIKELAGERKSDRVLKRINILVRSLGKASSDGERSYLLCELYFSTKYWMRNAPPTIQQKQHAAPLAALLVCVVRQLERLFDCDRTMLPAKLQQHYCCSENAHGIFCDEYDIPEDFRIRSELEKFKLYFEQGVVKWSPWWEKGTGTRALAPVNTSEAYKKATPTKPIRPNAAFFVMNRYRDMYAAPHILKDEKIPMYHSTLPKGEAVQFAGSIVIVDGKIKEICNDSGHYAPEERYLLNVFEHLKTVGVKLAGIKLFDFNGDELPEDVATAMKFMKMEGAKGSGFSGIRDRANARLAQRNAMGASIKGRVFADRLKEHMKTMPRDQALEKVFEEQFDQVKQGSPITPRLWEETWKDVLSALSAFWGDGHGIDKTVELVNWLQGKQAMYQIHPPAPPRPKAAHTTA